MKNNFLMVAVMAAEITMNMTCPKTLTAQNLSHEQRELSLDVAKQKLIDKVKNRGDLPHVSALRQLEIIEQLDEFAFGQFLIERGGLNGYWTHYVVTYPSWSYRENLQSLEEFLLSEAPTSLATQQRFSIFKEQIQQRIEGDISFASVPCGLMGEFLDLDYSKAGNFTLHGIDLDSETLSQAKSYAEAKDLLAYCQFSEKNAWHLEMNEAFDLLASNGLSIYEPDDKKVVELYRQFYTSLKPNGVLVTSFLTPPPAPGLKTEWKLDAVNLRNALLQKILFVDVLDAKWQVFRTEETVRDQLREAGFLQIEILYDQAHIFPTVIAKKC